MRFTLEPLEPLWHGSQFFRKDLDRHFTMELRIARSVDLPHTARTNGLDDFVMPKSNTRFYGHD